MNDITQKKYEELSNYTLDQLKFNKIVNEQKECVLSWVTQGLTAAGCVMNYVYDGNFWITTTTVRAKYEAICKNPNCSITISSQGTSVLGDASLSIHGVLNIIDNKDTKLWFYRELSEKLTKGHKLVNLLDSNNRVVMKLIVTQIKTYDGIKMAKDIFA